MVVHGVDLHGARQNLTSRVCDAGPFLALKLRAFARRQAPKDAFDILYTLLHYDRGTNAALAGFGEEVQAVSFTPRFADDRGPGCPSSAEAEGFRRSRSSASALRG